jgi:hypothetical protein
MLDGTVEYASLLAKLLNRKAIDVYLKYLSLRHYCSYKPGIRRSWSKEEDLKLL